MKRKIRFGTFETNSSSTHSMVITTKENFEKWENNILWFCHEIYDASDSIKEKLKEKNFFTFEEVKEILIEYGDEDEDFDIKDDESIKKWLDSYNYTFYSMKHWVREDEETAKQEYTCPDGTKIVVFAAYEIAKY